MDLADPVRCFPPGFQKLELVSIPNPDVAQEGGMERRACKLLLGE